MLSHSLCAKGAGAKRRPPKIGQFQREIWLGPRGRTQNRYARRGSAPQGQAPAPSCETEAWPGPRIGCLEPREFDLLARLTLTADHSALKRLDNPYAGCGVVGEVYGLIGGVSLSQHRPKPMCSIHCFGVNVKGPELCEFRFVPFFVLPS